MVATPLTTRQNPEPRRRSAASALRVDTRGCPGLRSVVAGGTAAGGATRQAHTRPGPPERGAVRDAGAARRASLVAASSPSLRGLAAALAGVALLVALGALPRAGVVAAELGWRPDGVVSFLRGPWQITQATIGTVAGIALVLFVRRSLATVDEDLVVVDALGLDLHGAVGLETAGLTAREAEVVELLGRGEMSDEAIAEALTISPATAGTHVRNIMRKLAVRDRRDVMLLARDARKRTDRAADGPDTGSR